MRMDETFGSECRVPGDLLDAFLLILSYHDSRDVS